MKKSIVRFALALPVTAWLSLALVPGLSMGAAPAAAQGARGPDNCVLDNCRDRRDYRSRDRFRDDDRGGGRRDSGDRRAGGRDYGSAPGRFDFYVLALSWSPSFCASDAGQRSRFQCRIGARNTFVVHGLWPQYNRGAPSYCNQSNPPRNVVENEGRVFPEFGLARYQWRKHGSCSGLSPSAYFRTVKQARDKIVVPPALDKLSQPSKADPDLIEKAFLAANKGLRPDNIAVTCKDGDFQEVRICVSKDMRSFVSCPEVDRKACRAPSMRIPAPR
ncbi:MAG: ribonuclease T [Beijerinckiaceae bacterium]